MVNEFKYLKVTIDKFLKYNSYTDKLWAIVAKKMKFWVECVNINRFLPGYSYTIL